MQLRKAQSAAYWSATVDNWLENSPLPSAIPDGHVPGPRAGDRDRWRIPWRGSRGCGDCFYLRWSEVQRQRNQKRTIPPAPVAYAVAEEADPRGQAPTEEVVGKGVSFRQTR